MSFVEPWQLRARFARSLSEMYGREVPAYTTLVDVTREVNEAVAAAEGTAAERLGSLDRVTAERHGAIRLGTPRELAQVARIFGAMSMYPVGFYDLRDAAPNPVPVVSTAFRPTGEQELARNPFRVFTSLLAVSDRRFFSAALQRRLEQFLDARVLFGPELLALADRAEAGHGLPAAEADRFLALATRAFELSREPIDEGWYRELERISAVAADIGGVASTHINHLTPRVLDIDELYARMQARGIAMIDAIQGPPRWDGPDVLLRQTSFRALAEPRAFRRADGSVHRSSLRVRFGEVEARGIALTAAGRALYDELSERAGRRAALERALPGHRARARRRRPRLLPVRARGRSPRRRHRPAGRRRRPDRRGLGHRPADRLRGLPTRFRGGHLPVEPQRRRHARRRRARARTSTPAGWPARSAASWPTRSRCTPPSASGRSMPSDARSHPTSTSPGADPPMSTTSPPTAPLTVTSTDELRARARAALDACGVALPAAPSPALAARSPITGEVLFDVPAAGPAEVAAAVAAAKEAFATWRTVPAPVRGALVKRLGVLLAEHKTAIAELITIEAGKIPSEALGEVQEMIDICDFAVGLSRQLDGRTMPSERPGHRLMETWHPLGVVGVISAFNFPAAVWSWNAAIALVCGDTVVWKPSPMTALTAAACSALLDRAAADCGAPANLNVLVVADAEAGQTLVDSPDVALLSATGSERMGAAVAPRVAARFGKVLLELGGNNAALVAPSADLELAARGITFAAAGTAGQRCTTMRRLIVHDDVADALVQRLADIFAGLTIGDPLADGTLVGPLINGTAYASMRAALDRAAADGGSSSSAAAGARPATTPTRTTSSRPSCGCRRRPTSSARRRSRRSSTS